MKEKEENNLMNLIEDSKKIIEKYDEIESSIENTNIFNMLKLEEHEPTHSKFIYNLIDITNKSEKRELFFEYFMKIVLNVEYKKEKTYEVYREFSIDNYCAEKGRLDFYIKDTNDNFGYGIEMKREAIDQERQLHRYKNFLEKEHGENNYKLFYLTPEGAKPSKKSTVGKTEYILISFKNELTNWVMECMKLSTNLPNLTGIMNQYLTIISDSMEDKKIMELCEILKKENNLRVIENLVESIEKTKEIIGMDFFSELHGKISTKFEINESIAEKHKKEMIFNNGLFYYKETEVKDALLCYGIIKSENSIEFIVGFEDKEEDKWITENIQKNKKIRKKISEIVEFSKEDSVFYYFWGIDNIDDFYYLHEEKNKEKRDKLMDKIIDIFEEKYDLLKDMFG